MTRLDFRGRCRAFVRQAQKVGAVALAIVLFTWIQSSAAYADDVTDVVMLTNGGRLRGVVAEEDPVKGVTIKLIDGTVRKLSVKEVKEIVHGSVAPIAPPPAPAAAQPIVMMAPPPYAGYPGYPPPARPTERQSTGLWAGGRVLTILGSLTLPVGGTTIATSDECKHDSQCPAGAALLVGGSLFLSGGIVMMVMGGKRVPVTTTGWMPTQVAVSARNMSLGWSF